MTRTKYILLFTLSLWTWMFSRTAVCAPRIPQQTRGYALIVTNNHSLELSRPDLKYADDDGAKYADLFSEAFGRDRVALLTEFDPDSRRLYPRWVAAAKAPSRANLKRAVKELARIIAADREQGSLTEVYIVLAGHGDIDKGQGFVELSDGRLTATALEFELVRAIKADRIHLIIDSCNSYFMLNPRKPGGKRWKVDTDSANNLVEKYPHVGATLSTSAESVTYEWSTLQSGIFSYEVRSALRGGADVDNDGRVRYDELAAFVSTANSGIVNELYRPRVFVQGPNHDNRSVLMQLDSMTRVLELPSAAKRVTVRDAYGVRLLDVNKEAGGPLRLRLPVGDENLAIYETVQGGHGQRTQIAYYEAPTVDASVGLVALTRQSPAVTSRGESPVFSQLFSEPFGPLAMRAYTASAPQRDAMVYGVSKREAERLSEFLALTARPARRARLWEGAGSLVGSAVFVGAGAVLFTYGPEVVSVSRRQANLMGAVYVGIGGVLAVNGALSLSRTTEAEKIQSEFVAADQQDEAARTLAVLTAERRIDALLRLEHKERRIGAGLQIGFGSAMLGGGVALAAVASTNSELGPPMVFAAGSALVAGALLVGKGIGGLYICSRNENIWSLYSRDGTPFRCRARRSGRKRGKQRATFNATLGGVSGRF